MTLNVNQSIQIRLTQLEMEDDLNFRGNGRQQQFFLNGRRPQLFGEMEDDLNLL
jgi:hypothetical protein